MAFAAMSFDVNEQLNQYLDEWKNDAPNENVIEILSKISEVIEKETETYYKMDPDPFDDRHPSRAKPTCSFGPLLKNLFKNDDFMNKLVNDYLMNRDDKELQIASCRLVLDILPGLETSVVFNDTDGLLERLLSWARSAEEPLQSYAIGLLAAAMDVQDIAAHSKEQNIQLMPIMIVKLKDLIKKSLSESNHIEDEEIPHQTPYKRRRISSPSNECSNSSWAEMEPLMIGSAKIFPLTNEISQRFIYQYLTSLGVYQDMLSFVFEHSVLSLILNTIDLNKNGDVRLAFDALKYLASLLCHKKFALEFVNAGGIQSLLKVNRQSVAANGVAYCLNCIAYHDDVMEKICFLPHHVLENLVSYALWLIETSHDSSRSNAMIFFSLSFSYRMILNLFDSQDGFRKIINEISMIDLFSSPSSTYSEDEIFTKRQYAKHVCFALKRYYEAHLIIRTHELLKNSSYSNKISPRWARLININVPPYKTINYDYELYMEHVEALLHLMPTRAQWRPVDDLIKFNGAKLLIQYISLSYDWNFTGKADAVRSALDVLVVCSVMAKFQALLGDSVVINEGHSTAGMRIILAAACGDIVNDADCQRSALNVIINCVCGPLTRPGNSTIRLSMSSSKKKSKCYDDVLKQMWTSVRFNNGIMILLNLMMIKTPITDADSIRTLSCKALCGLARSETVRQVMGKLPLFSNGQIQALLKEPILQDKRSEHIKFVKYCLELIASVTGAPVETTSLEDSVGNNLNKAEVITQTKIVFNEKELLQLIYKHLVEKGLSKTAQALVDEAKLTEFANSFAKNSSFSKFNTPPRALPRVSRQIPVLSQNSNLFATPSLNVPSSTSHNDSSSNLNNPIRINRTQRSSRVNNSNNVASISNRRQSIHFTSPMAKRRTDFSSNNVISLDSIVIEYLRKQHALCKNPVVTCPPFDLFKPHRCPDPKNNAIAPVNITSRLQNRQVFPPSGGMFGSKMDRKFIYSRFRPFRSLRAFDPTNFLCSAFSYSGNLLYVGTDNGELHVFNYLTSEIETTFPCYDSIVSSIEPSWDGKMLLTSSYWDSPNSILWSVTESSLDQKLSFTHDNHVEFGKAVQDKVLGTAEFAAHLYSLGTGQLVRTFDDEDYANRYVKNIATFHPSDHLILNDGVLWDIRSEKPIHKFDKFNQHINGIFHPNGQEIISNSEIWDIKTYKLLNTVPALSGSHIKFNKRGNVIYGVYEDDSTEDLEEDKLPFSSSYRTFDGRDYSSIATIDVKRSITHLAIDPSDNYIAIIENQCNRDTSIFSHDKVARVYEIGKCREEDDEERDDDDEDEGDEESDGDSYDDDDDDIMADELMSDSSSNALDLTDMESEYETSNSSSISSDDESDEEIFYQLNN